MQRITQVIVKGNEKETGICRFFEAENKDFFCIEIPNHTLKSFVYDCIMLALDGQKDLPPETSAYLESVYTQCGLKRAYVEVTIEEDGEFHTYRFDFTADKKSEDVISTLLSEELKEDGFTQDLFGFFPPAVLLDEDRTLLKNTLCHITYSIQNNVTLILDGETIPENMMEDFSMYPHGIVNITGNFDPSKWALKGVWEAVPEIRKEKRRK